MVLGLADILSALGMEREFPPDPDHHPIDPTMRVTDLVSHDQERLDEQWNIWKLFPHARMGGVSVAWLREQLRQQYRVAPQFKDLKNPVLLLQSDQDSFVYNCAMNDFYRKAPLVRKVFFPGTYPELLQEVPVVRDAAISMAIDFFEAGEEDLRRTEDTDRGERWKKEVTAFSGLPKYNLGFLFHNFSLSGVVAGAMLSCALGFCALRGLVKGHQ